MISFTLIRYGLGYVFTSAVKVGVCLEIKKKIFLLLVWCSLLISLGKCSLCVHWCLGIWVFGTESVDEFWHQTVHGWNMIVCRFADGVKPITQNQQQWLPA